MGGHSRGRYGPRVVVLDDYEGALSGSAHLDPLREHVVLERIDRPLSSDELESAVAGVPIVVALRERTRFDASTLARMPSVELLIQTGGHAYHIDVETATRQGISIALGRYTVGSSRPTPVVAELVMGLLISWYRRLPAAIEGMRAGRWPASLGRSLSGRRIGILGLGRHGRTVAALAGAFGMEVVAWGPTLTPGRAQEAGVQHLDLEELLATCDVVSVHLKLSDSSEGLIGERELSLMRTDAVIVNTARGPIIDEDALVGVLRRGDIGGALLDVFDQEPLPADHPLRKLPNVLCTPHLGYTVDSAFDDFARTTARQLSEYLRGVLPSEVLLNPAVLGNRPSAGLRSRIGCS